LFLAVVIDLFSRQLVGWSLREDLTRDIVIDALRMAWFKRHPSKQAGLILQALSGAERPSDKVLALFDAFAKRVEESSFRRSCAAGAVSLDLDEALESLRQVAASAFACWSATIAAHFEFGDAAQKRSFAGFVLTAIEGAYVRSRAEHSGQPFRDAGHWLSQLVPPPGQGALPVHQPVSGLRRNKAVGAAVPVRTQPRGRRG
jgi:hypothetical protein